VQGIKECGDFGMWGFLDAGIWSFLDSFTLTAPVFADVGNKALFLHPFVNFGTKFVFGRRILPFWQRCTVQGKFCRDLANFGCTPFLPKFIFSSKNFFLFF
jgi:hypothetical protein